MPSTDRSTISVPVPPAFPAMWRAWKRGYEAEPRLIVVAFGLALLSALPDALLALWLKYLADDAKPERLSSGNSLAGKQEILASVNAQQFLPHDVDPVAGDRTGREVHVVAEYCCR